MNMKIIGIVIVTMTLGVGVGYWLANKDAVPTTEAARSVSDTQQPATVDDSDAPGTVRIDPVTVQDIGVRTALAIRTTMTRDVRSVGRVAYDEKRIARLHPKSEGWIDELRVNETGMAVRKDEILLSIYAPKLVSTQQEYLLALNNLSALQRSPIDDIRRGAEELAASSRERLRLFDVPEHQIKKLEETREVMKYLHIQSPFSGIVVNIGARNGQYVTPQNEIYMIADLSRVWVYVYVYEYELPWIRVGDEVEMTVAALPGKVFTGNTTYIYPYLEADTRTIKVRLEFDNPEIELKPNMFANVNIRSSKQVDAIVVPDQAVLRTGERDTVFVVRGAGKYEPRDVTLGSSSEGMVQILSGLEEGEEIVTSALFLIDSESNLREASSKMMEVEAPVTADPRPDTDDEPEDIE